jgi:hypothetical protein
MRKSFTQLFSVLTLICVFGFQASTFAQGTWDDANSVPVDDAMNVDPVDIATHFVVAFSDVPVFTANGGTMTVSKEGSLVKVIPINSSNSDVQVVEKTLQVAHGMDIEEETDYTITLTSNAVTVDGDAVGISSWDFTVGDFTAPVLVAEDPLSPVGAAVEATILDNQFDLTLVFNEDVLVGEGTIAIYQENGTVVELIDVANLVPTQNISILGGEVTVTVDDEARFKAETMYYVKVDAGAFTDNVSDYGPDAEANDFAGITDNTTWTFTTRDNTAPEITLAVVENTATTVTFSVELSEEGNFYYVVQPEAAAAPTVLGDYSDAVEADANTVVEIDEDGLVGNTKYEIYVIAENTEDPENVTVIPGEKVVFTTTDDKGPVSVARGTIEEDNVTTGVYYIFDEEVAGGTGSLDIRKVENNALVTSIPASAVTSMEIPEDEDYDGNWKVVFDFGLDLESEVDYYIVFPEGYIVDMLGNKYGEDVVGVYPVPVAESDWVISGFDFEAPVVTFWTTTQTTEKTTEITGAGNDDNIYIQFDEGVSLTDEEGWPWSSGDYPGTQTRWSKYVTFQQDGVNVAAQFSYNSTADRIEINPYENLESNSVYTVTLLAGTVEDENGNITAAEHSINVTTGDNDLPTYTITPATTTELVGNTELVVTFSKDVFVSGTTPAALTSDDLKTAFTLTVNGTAVNYIVVYDAATMTATVTADDGFETSECVEGSVDYNVVVLTPDFSDLEDSKGAAFTGAVSATWNVADYKAPVITLFDENPTLAEIDLSDAVISSDEVVELVSEYAIGTPNLITVLMLKADDVNGVNLPFTYVKNADEVILSPDGWSWEVGKTYYYGIGAAVEDCAGNVNAATYGTFTVEANPTDPTVEAVTYTVNGGSAIAIDEDATDVEVNTGLDVVIQVTFNMNVDDLFDPTNIVATTFVDGVPAAIDVPITSANISGKILTITVADPVIPAASTTYTVTIPAGLVEANETYAPGMKAQLEEDVVITLVTADNEAPSIVSNDVAATDVAVDLETITVTFSEKVVLGSGNVTITESGETTAEQTIGVTSNTVTIAEDGMSAEIAVADLDKYFTTYDVEIPKTAFEDEAGNVLSDDPYAFSFVTEVNPQPVVETDGLYPAHGADLIPLQLNLTMEFSEEVEQASVLGSRKLIYVVEKVGTADASINLVDGELQNLGNDTVAYHTYVEETDNVGFSGNLVTIKNVELKANTDYYVLITPGAFKDKSQGNSAVDYPVVGEYAGIVTPGIWEFSTSDVIAPEVSLAFSKLGLDEKPATDSDILVEFTKPIEENGGDQIVSADIPTWLILEKNVSGVWTEIEFTATISDDNKTITIENSSLVVLGELKGSTEYRVSFPSGVLQGSGNENVLGAWTSDPFETSDYDAPAAPAVDFTDTDDATSVYVDKGVHTAELTLSDKSAGDAVEFYYFWTANLDDDFTAQQVMDLGTKVDGDDMPADLEFAADMVNETEYRVVAVGVDAAGNVSEVSEFTYWTDDVVAPELAEALPSAFSIADELNLVFNEDVVPVVGAYARVIDANGAVYSAPLANLTGDDADANIITVVISAAGLPISNDVATYTIELDPGMIVDVPRVTADVEDANDPNEFAGILGTSFAVTSDDEVSPMWVSIDPDGGDVSLTPSFEITFSEAVELNDNFTSFVIYEMNGASVQQLKAAGVPYDVLTVDNVSGEGTSTITLTTNRALVSERDYLLVMIDETFSDLAGNLWKDGDKEVWFTAKDVLPLNVLFRVPQDGLPYYLPSDVELEYVPEELCIVFGTKEGITEGGFDPDYMYGDNVDYEEYFIDPNDPINDINALKTHVYLTVDGEAIPFEVEVSGEYNHKIWIVADLEDYKGQTITYGFINLYDENGNLNTGEEVSFVIAEDAVPEPDPLVITPGDGDYDSDDDEYIGIEIDQVFTVEFDGIIFSYDGAVEEDNNLIMSADLLESLGVFELYNDDEDAEVELEVLTYSEETGKSVVTFAAVEPLASDNEFELTVHGEYIQIGQGNDVGLDHYYEYYSTGDVVAPHLVMDGDEVDEDAYYPTNGGVAVKDDVLGLYFNEEVVGAGVIEIHRWDGTLVAEVDVTGNESEDGEGWWFIELGEISDIMDANAGFVTDEDYYVIVPAGAIEDIAGNEFAGITVINEWTFELQDDNNPVVTFVQNEQSNVPVTTTIDLLFDRDVELNPGEMGWLAIYEEVDGDAVQLIRINNDMPAEDLGVAMSAYSFEIEELQADTKYYVELGKGSFVLSADGETAQQQVNIGEWWFTTETNDAPEVVSFQPAHEPELTHAVLPMTDLVITFDQEVIPGVGSIQLHNRKDVGDDIITSFDVTNPQEVVFDSTTVTIPADVLGLLENSAYYVVIPGTAISNNSVTPEYWEGVTTPLEWQFSTLEDATPPELASYTPQDTIEGTHPTFEMTFVENVVFGEAGTLTVTEKDSTDPILVLDITEADIVDNVITIEYDTMVTGGLNKNTTYIVNVSPNVVTNSFGIAWGGVTDETTWTFTTGENFTTGIDDRYESVDFKVYPNPFNDRVRIDNYDKLTRVVITNIAGQRVLDIEYPSYEIRTSSLTTGVYVVSMFTESGMAKSERIVKR